MIYFVGTPIGNLKDISLRAIEVLKEVDYIACEDTRTSRVLLNQYDIHTKLVAYHKFNEKEASQKILHDAKEKNIAIISDAGLPVISDPGYVLVQALQKEHIPYTVVAGPSAVTNAFILSGLPAPFTFLGFLPDKKKDREALLQEFLNVKTALVIYVSPHHLEQDLKDIYDVLGNRKMAVVREMTKVYEEVVMTTLEEGYSGVVKGEFVVVVGQPELENKPSISIEEQLRIFEQQGIPKLDAIKEVAKIYHCKKNDVYQIALTMKDWQ